MPRLNTDICSSYKHWFDGGLIDLILMKSSVRSLSIGRFLTIFFDRILKNSLGLTVSCHMFHQVAILWNTGLGGLGLWVGGVLQPSGQRCPHPFLVSFRQYT